MGNYGSYNATTGEYTVERQNYEYDSSGQNNKVNNKPSRDDFHGTSGSENYTTGYTAWAESMTALEAATTDAQSVYDAAAIDAEAAVKAAFIDADARKHEADQALEATKLQCTTDKEIATLEYEVEIKKLDVEQQKIEEVDSVNAQANMRASDALFMEAEAEMEEAEAERDEAKYKYYYGSGNSVW